MKTANNIAIRRRQAKTKAKVIWFKKEKGTSCDIENNIENKVLYIVGCIIVGYE